MRLLICSALSLTGFLAAYPARAQSERPDTTRSAAAPDATEDEATTTAKPEDGKEAAGTSDASTQSATDGDEPQRKKKKKHKDGDEAADDEARDGGDPDDTSSPEGDVRIEGDPWEGTPRGLRALGLNFRFLLQTRYRQTFPVESKNTDSFYREAEKELVRNGDGWDINRGFFGVSAEPTKYFGLKLVFDLAELRHNKPKKAVKQLYADLRPIPKHLHFAVGVLKLPYSIHELDAIARYEFTSSGPANNMISDLGFGGRDIGAQVIVSPFSKQRYLTITAGVYRGHANDENASPVGAVGGRIETSPIAGLRLGAGAVMQPTRVVDLNALDTSGKDLLPNPSNPAYPRSRTWEKGSAFGADITYKAGPIRLRLEGLLGDRVDYDMRYGATQWADAWGTLAYRLDVGAIALEPAARVEYFDADFKRDIGLQREFAFALGVHFNRSTKLVMDVARTEVQDNSPVLDQPLPLREVPFNGLSNTRVAAQLQVAL